MRRAETDIRTEKTDRMQDEREEAERERDTSVITETHNFGGAAANGLQRHQSEPHSRGRYERRLS